MHRLLFISDDWASKKPWKSALLERGFALIPLGSAACVAGDVAELPKQPVDLIIVDLERCATEGASLCRILTRERPWKEAPLLLLATGEQVERLDFSWGMEDYLTLPVSAAHLAARVTFLLWKAHRLAPPNGISHSGLRIDVERYEVQLNGEPVDVTYKEFELLKFLATQPGKAFTREVLLDKVWGYDYYGGTRTVDVHIRRLRSKLEAGGATYIETVRNVGYKFLASSSS